MNEQLIEKFNKQVPEYTHQISMISTLMSETK